MIKTIVVRRRSLVRVLVLIALALSVASYGMQVFMRLTGHDSMLGLAVMLDVDREQSFSTWFQVLVLAGAALGIYACGKRDPDSTKRGGWGVWAAIVLFMSIDEQVGIHERMKVPAAWLGHYAAFHNHSWIVAGLLAAALVAALVGRFVLELPATTRQRVLSAAALYLAGAIGLESAAGVWTVLGLPRDLAYHVLPTLKELLEMAGTIMLLDAILRLIEERGGVGLEVRED